MCRQFMQRAFVLLAFLLSTQPAMSSNQGACEDAELFDVAVVGAGLSGLVIAQALSASRGKLAGLKWVLLEASSSRVGGRLQNAPGVAGGLDMGGAWVWPAAGGQWRVASLLDSLSIETFKVRARRAHILSNVCPVCPVANPSIETLQQPDEGPRGGSMRIRGGAAAMTNALASALPAGSIRMGFEVSSCSLVPGSGGKGSFVQLTAAAAAKKEETASGCAAAGADDRPVRASTVVFAVPPALLSTQVAFTPALSPARQSAMRASKTWMAGVTKVAITFPPPKLDGGAGTATGTGRFWDSTDAAPSTTNTGLRPGPGRPAFQVYDGSSDFDGKEFAAITFFALATGVKSDAELAALCARQLAEVWSSEARRGEGDKVEARTSRLLEAAGEPSSVHIQRWPEEEFISGPHEKVLPLLSSSSFFSSSSMFALN